MMIKEYATICDIAEPLVSVARVSGANVGDKVEILRGDGEILLGRVIELQGDIATVLLYDGASGLDSVSARARMSARKMELFASEDMLGRAFDGLGRPRDGGAMIIPEAILETDGGNESAIERPRPAEFIQTGISAIDALCPLARGQILSLFSSAGLPHTRVAARITCNAANSDGGEKKCAVVFCSIGLSFEDADYFRECFLETGVIERTVMFINLAGDPSAQRAVTPALAMTAAEYLAFEKDMQVLLLISDMKNYADAIKEISAARGETPGPGGYPLSLFNELASLLGRGGVRRGRHGSVTVIPVAAGADSDASNGLRDILGQISHGQIRLSNALHQRGIYPPIDPLGSMSRAASMCAVREGHMETAGKIIAAYADDARFALELEREFISQPGESMRDIDDTLDLAKKMLNHLQAPPL